MNNMNNMCSICHIDFEKDEKNLAKLRCGHIYHYECIFITYKNNKNSTRSKSIRVCPYCRKNGGYLKLEKANIPIKNIHEEYNIFMNYLMDNNRDKYIEYLDKNKCYAILKTGINKGLQCNSKPINNNFCKRHNKILNI